MLSEYVAQLVAGGYSIEYFIEGGRSRTGRMLQPKTGMLAIPLRSFLRSNRLPIVFVPVYIGYERVLEGRTTIEEVLREKDMRVGLLKSRVDPPGKVVVRVVSAKQDPVIEGAQPCAFSD